MGTKETGGDPGEQRSTPHPRLATFNEPEQGTAGKARAAQPGPWPTGVGAARVYKDRSLASGTPLGLAVVDSAGVPATPAVRRLSDGNPEPPGGDSLEPSSDGLENPASSGRLHRRDLVLKRLLANAKTAHLATVEACNRASSARVSLSGTASAWEVLANDARSKEAHARQALVVEAETWKALACAALDWQDIVPIGEPYEAISPGENAPNLDPAKIARMALEKQALALESLAEFHSRPEHQQAVSKEPQQQKTLGLTVDDQPSSSEEAISDFTTTNLSEIHPFEREARVLSFDLLKNSPHTSEPRSTIVLVTILILVSIAIFLTCVAPPDDRPPDVIAISIAKAVAPWYLGGCLIALFGFLLQRKGR